MSAEKGPYTAVFGIGRSGVAAANLLARAGERVILSDTRGADALASSLAQLDEGVEVVTGENYWAGASRVVVSPGLPPRLPIFDALAEAGVPVIAEVELAFAHCPAPIVAITGTDGKTTTTSLLGDIMRLHQQGVVVGGNIGTPLCEVVQETDADGLVVAEISAFQLWTTRRFRAVASGVTNIAADHLDYFDEDMPRYAAAKRILLDHAQPGDWAVLNAGDPEVSSWAEGFAGEVAWYGLERPADDVPTALWRADGALHARWRGESLGAWLRLDEAALRGPHNHLNMMCAAGVALSRGVAPETIAQACRDFAPLAHRMQRLGQREGVTFWDDSKATNAHAALAGLRGLEEPVVPIVGGVDKGLDLSGLVAHLHAHAPHVVLLGAIAQRLHDELLAAGVAPERLHHADSMDDAVHQAAGLAQEGWHVTLSPACSSFDMFDSYAHRGRVFQACVSEMGVS